jgi:chemotaxis protein MotB
VADDTQRPIVIKRIKKAGGGAHGGAWKIAYADFVTAMMAFFLLMWLLGSSTKAQLQGISEYFKTPLKVAMMGGEGSGDATSIIKGGGEDISKSSGQVKNGETKATRKTMNFDTLKNEIERSEAVRLRELQTRLEGELRANPKLAAFSSQIRMEMTRDGLRIQIVDDQARPMFDSGSAVVKEYMRDVLVAIGSVLGEVPNKLTIEGHTDATPFVGGERGYSNWELSSDRANASRRTLLTGGLAEERVLRVQGLASSQPLERDDPKAATNRRISIVVLNREAERRYTSPQIEEPPEISPVPGRR